MNNLMIFKNNEFGDIRIMEKDGKVYAVGSDVAKALGYAIPSKAVNTHCKGVSKMEVPTNGGVQEMLIITEGDIYRLIAKSKLPSAESFESWVFDEVLPSIRKHGAYMTDKGIQYKVNNTYVLYSDYADLGYVSIKQQILDNGKEVYNRHFTQDGRKFILNLYK